ncbi:DUF2182 domain-containing protein [Sabulicella glaciei]|uniref:DUF2182 domain-containing protein n=1 Tax=Sabulicella glaciei TaxID=2984948 RepID=A0ABT3P1K9_9PROT|nr:DUF2182 domain-containing protein [Roseococcus sp. MDT2-1-1]MCW8088281.1 DUF2182 domain-containing protein [Roseococcus sp. MDT2-1-1]
MSGAGTLDRVLRRDRVVASLALAVVALLAWAYLVLMAGMPMDMAAMAAPAPAAWSAGHAAMMLLMWALMMLAMMLPSAAPMILLYGMLTRRQHPGDGSVGGRVLLFAAGYVAVWSGFAVAATALQWALERAMLLSPAMATGSAALASALFVAAGAYQFTPLKQACLRRCRSPLEFLAGHWRSGAAGAWAMGLRHGAFCVGCCWVIMGLLFVGGVMNLAWIAALALLVLAEKILPGGRLLGHAMGAGLIAWGALGMLTAFV